MKYTVLPLALIISMASAAEDGWVAVGQGPAATPASQTATSSADSPSNSSFSPSANTSSPAAQGGSLQLELLTMVETMQQEIAELRGTVEEQNHKIDVLQKQQQQRYLDLDRRMAELMKNSNSRPAPSANTGDAGVQAPDDLYATAMAFIKKKDFNNALVQLDLFAKTYPEHSLAANAFYWSGEVQLAQGNFELAIQMFKNVIENHPKHNKAADSHYKLAVAYDRSGDSVIAKEILQQVVSQYPGISDSAVRLAERYLSRLESSQ
jgi:tol-pal system protein YbgF